LREHELVKAERDGRSRRYALYDEHVRALLEAGLGHVELRDGQERRSARRSAG